MMDFLGKVKRFIAANSLLRRDGTVIVALSGGADSVALLVALLRLGYDCTAAHCNFHLRGEESNRDMHSAERLTASLGIDLYVKDFDVAARRKLSGESLEMACRSLRYDWFYDLLDRDGAQAIAVGHHREDQAETFFLNLMRGSGMAGLAGMRPRTGHVVRPLLDVSRAEIEDFLRAEGIAWVVDSTNASDDFARNRLRNRLIPDMERLFPGAADAILRSMAFLRETHDFFTEAAASAIAPFTDANGDIDLVGLSSATAHAPLLLYEHLKGEGFSRKQTDDMLRAASRSGGRFKAGESHVREVDHGILRAPRAAISGDECEVRLSRDILDPVHIAITRHGIAEFSPARNPAVAYVDASALDGNPVWRLRRWHRGDRMVPFGMTESKLLSDIFADARLSAAQKEGLWLLTRNDEIVWAVGLRASALFSLTPASRRYLRLELVTN